MPAAGIIQFMAQTDTDSAGDREETVSGLVDRVPTAAITAPGRRPDGSTVAGDLSGALVAAVVSVSESIPYGLLVFAALGASFGAEGVMAGLYASIFAAVVAAALGGSRIMISGPRASTAVLMATIVATLAQAPGLEDHGGATMAVALTFLVVLIAGALQILFGLARLGHTIKFAPYPVIAGFMNGVAVLLLLGQLNFLLGLPEHFAWTEWRALPEAVQPWTMLVAAVTIAAIVIGPRLTRHVPSLVVGLAAGIAVFYAVAASEGLDVLGPIIGDIPAADFTPDALAPLAAVPWSGWMAERLMDLAPSIVALAVIASIDSLMGAAALDTLTGTRHDSNRELVAQGLANVVSGVMGGLPVSGAVARSAASFHAGARTRLAGIVHALLVLATSVIAGPWVGTVPRVVLAGVLTVVAFGMIDTWSRELISRLKTAGGYRREIAANLAVVLSVAAVTVLANLIVAVAVGLAIAMVLFVTQMSKPIVRRVTDARSRRSLKVRERTDAELIAAHGAEVAIIELDGPLFFGTADALLTEAEKHAASARMVILDFRRVSEMDATGVRLLAVMTRTLIARGVKLALAHVTPDNDFGRFIAAIGGRKVLEAALCFADTDAALEWAEDCLVATHASHCDIGRELALSELCLAKGLTAQDIDTIARYVNRRTFAAGEALFREGVEGDALYLLARGIVTISLAHADPAAKGNGAGAIRLASMIPGVMFGEMSLLEGQPRSADATATTDIVVYEMNKADFARVMSEHPALAARLSANMAREIAARLRVTSDQLRAIS
jgi:SulP family sulfate permease